MSEKWEKFSKTTVTERCSYLHTDRTLSAKDQEHKNTLINKNTIFGYVSCVESSATKIVHALLAYNHHLHSLRRLLDISQKWFFVASLSFSTTTHSIAQCISFFLSISLRFYTFMNSYVNVLFIRAICMWCVHLTLEHHILHCIRCSIIWMRVYFPFSHSPVYEFRGVNLRLSFGYFLSVVRGKREKSGENSMKDFSMQSVCIN